MSELPPHVIVPTVVGHLALPRDDRTVTPWIVERGDWEPGESAAMVALLRPGDRVVDVGAHVGFLSLLAAHRVGPGGSVLSVEAHPGNFALLRDNVRRGGHAQVETVHAAAWRAAGETVTLTVSEGNSGDNRSYDRDDAVERVAVETVRVDDLLAGRDVDFVKVDVQGTDHVALEGMRATIERCRPTVMIEFWPLGIDGFGDDPAEVLTGYRALGYELSVLEFPGVGNDAPADALAQIAREARGGFVTLLLRAPDRAR